MVTRTGTHDSLTGEVLDLLGWDGASGLPGPTPANRRDGPAGPDVATDGDGSGPEDEDSDGFLSGLLGR